MGHSTVRCAKTAEPIDMPFWMKTRVGPGNHVLHGVQIPQGKGQFSGVVRAIQKHWQPLLHRSLQRRCKRDHSIANNVIRQANANSILTISGRRRCGLSAAKVCWNCTTRAKADIYTIAILKLEFKRQIQSPAGTNKTRIIFG